MYKKGGGIMNKEELDLLEIVFTFALGECAYNDINNIQKLKDKIKTIGNLCKKQQKVINKASNDLQQIMNDINDKTIISFGQFVYKLEVIQDELGGSNDILNEVSE